MLCYNTSSVIKRLIAMLFAGGALIYSQLVEAHPHSFIDMDATFISEKETLVGIKMVWTMDEMTSADLLYDAENAKSDSEIWKKLAAEVMANVLGQHYFTDIYRDGHPVKYKNLPTEYHLSRKGHQAVLTFVLPLAEPQPLVGKPFIISTYDPTYFVDMTYAEDKAVRLSAEMEKNCKLTLFTPNPNASLQAYALSLDKSDSPGEDMELGKQFAQRVTVQCQ
ncbi:MULTISPECIES: DUF1007 family protein [Yersinia]|uniref:DUF1007 family protein n=1 Tax=Yersinia TaxID=629 RepID=UPI0005E3D168|nr:MULTISPECIES: DUF1007 family protein [Yersinia]OVZ97440.1 hypothetical protein CBW53_10005 [Yersinia frederiksenii]RXA96114.1 DUF1007 family protein [Yersinia sp. 2105 StPb PI]CNI87053.1 putative periplasmic or exported protein [Yersinia frederiksenii]CNI87659.1 putative periplasmic or exported protein [Yersinia frederiksenii]CNK44406.1 putative periplasmic or exported protein [Yersinia frederiksenii]